MSHADNAQRVEDFYALLLGDFPAFQEKYIGSNFEWENPLPEGIPFGGTYKGSEGLLQYLMELGEAIEMSPLHFTDIVGDGSVVSVIGVEQDTVVKSTGKTYTMPFVHVLRFDDEGKATHVREHNDTRDMVEAFTA